MLLSFIVFVLNLSCEKNKNKQKEAGFGQFFLKTMITNPKNIIRSYHYDSNTSIVLTEKLPRVSTTHAIVDGL